MDNQQKNSRRWSKEEDDYIKANYIYRDNDSVNKIASYLGRSRKSVNNHIAILGLSGVKRFQDVAMKYKTPTPQLAYLLGVYLSDGSTHKDVFLLGVIDKDFCEAVIDALDHVLDGEYNKVIREYSKERLNKNRTEIKYSGSAYHIRIRSTDFVTWLRTVTDCKSIIPQEFIDLYPRELLAGLMDGDGSCTVTKQHQHIYGGYKISLCGHKYIYGSVSKYPAIFNKLGINYKESYPGDGMTIYTLDKKDFINAGCYFNISRKQNRLNKLREILNERHGISDDSDNGAL